MKILLLLLALFAPAAYAQEAPALPFASAPQIAAKAYVLTDFYSGQVLAGKNIHQRMEPASLTKLMTAYLAFAALKQKLIKPDQVLPVSEKAWHAEGSRMFIEPGKPVTVDELLHGMIVQSGNDASIALAEGIAGSEDAFVQMMNKEAARLGMKDTHFMNATGLPHPQHYSSAYDMALLAAAIIRDFPEYYPLYSTKEYTYNHIKQANRNRLLWTDPNVDGLKTGYTEAAGYCLVASAHRPGRRLVSVVMGSASENARAIESQKLLNWGLQFYDTVRLYQKGQPVATIPVWKGAEKSVTAGFDHDLFLSLPKGEMSRLKAALERKEPLLAPVSTGEQVGTLKLSFDGKPLAQYPLVALKSVAIGNIFGRAWDSLKLLLK